MIIGIDPGMKGGLAFLPDKGPVVAIAAPIITFRDTYTIDAKELARILVDVKDIKFVAIEAARVISGGEARKTMFNYGVGFGVYLGVIGALGLRVIEIDAAKWKREMGVPADKREAMRIASELMPDGAQYWEKMKHDGLAEAALIAYYAKRKMLLGAC